MDGHGRLFGPSHDVHGLRGHLPGQQGVQGSAQAINVGTGVCFTHAVLFGRRIAGGDAAGALGGLRVDFKDFDQAKIYQHGLSHRVDDDVGWFDIAVDQWLRLGVQVLQCIRNLADPDNGLVISHRPTGYNLGFQVFALDKVHHHVLAAPG